MVRNAGAEHELLMMHSGRAATTRPGGPRYAPETSRRCCSYLAEDNPFRAIDVNEFKPSAAQLFRSIWLPFRGAGCSVTWQKRRQNKSGPRTGRPRR